MRVEQPNRVPQNGEFFDGKLWFNRKSSIVTVGLTNSAIEEVGEVGGVEFPSDGERFKKGDIILTLDGTHGNLDILAPVDGTVHEVNDELIDQPEMITDDPLEGGWLFKFEVEDPEQLIGL